MSVGETDARVPATRPRALFFDLDETLLDGSRFRESIVRTCTELAERQRDLDAARLLEANEQAWGEYWPEVEGQWELGALGGAAVTLEGWRRTLRACGCEDESLARSARDMHLRFARETFRLHEGAPGAITTARAAGIPLTLITNGASDAQRDKLRTLGIEGWFDSILISGEVGVAKPDPRIFELAIAELGLDRAEVWHVGDNLRADVGGARAAGITAVWVNRAGRSRADGDPEPDLEIRSLSELGSGLRAESL